MAKLVQPFRWLCVTLLLGASPALWADSASAASPARLSSPFFGRWTVSDKDPVFTARGRAYKTIDVGVCGQDFCGVSVDDRGVCGAALFRFLAKHADGEDVLRGHGKWGGAAKTVQISWTEEGWDDKSPSFHKEFELYLGDGHDFGGRSSNMPKFHAYYRQVGAARCFTR